MRCQSRNGSARCHLLLAALTAGLSLPRAAAAAQDPAPTPVVGPITPRAEAEPAAEQGSAKKEDTRKKKREKLKFHWRSASVDYGKKVRLDFRSKIRGEV